MEGRLRAGAAALIGFGGVDMLVLSVSNCESQALVVVV